MIEARRLAWAFFDRPPDYVGASAWLDADSVLSEAERRRVREIASDAESHEAHRPAGQLRDAAELAPGQRA